MMGQNKKQVDVSRSLKWVLLIDVFTTGPFGLVLLLFGDQIGMLIGFDHSTMIRLIGFGLIVLVSFIFWAANQKNISASMLLIFAIIDLIWVIDSIVLISFSPLTVIGIVGVVAVALMVAIIAILKFYFYLTNQKIAQLTK